MNQDELAIIKNYLNEIEKNKNSSVFLEPVDYVGLNILDYPQIIKHPMDLSTIRKKIKPRRGEIATAGMLFQFLATLHSPNIIL